MIIYIIISVVSLVFILFEYFGLTRCLKLKVSSCESYAKTYVKLPRVGTKNKVIVSLYTKHNDLNKIKDTVNSILDQTVRPDQIIISIPDSTSIKIPEFITKNHIILVHKLSKDYGKSSSFISPLLREKNGNTDIIIIDDNQIYGPDFIESLVEASEKYPNDIIYIGGYNARKYIENGGKIDEDADIIELPKGVLIKPIFFDENILNIDDGPSNQKDVPNVILSYHAQKNKVHLRRINYSENIYTIKDNNNFENNIIKYYAAYFPSFN